MKKRLFTKVIAVAIVMIMMLSVCAPIVSAAANNDDGTNEKKDLVYVSIGDSMTNGYGLEGYDGESGILNYGIDTYANQFAAWLAGYEGDIADDQIIFEGDKAVVDHRQLAMSGMRAEDLHWILDFDHTDAELAERVVDSQSFQTYFNEPDKYGYRLSKEQYDHWCIERNFGEQMKYRWYHDPLFDFKAGDYRTWWDLMDPDYRLANGAAKILNTYYDPNNDAYGFYKSSYAGVETSNNKTIAEHALDSVGDPYYPEDNETDYLEVGKYVWLQVATEFYQESVADADVISLALGNTNFGTWMFQYMKEIIANSEYSETNNDFVGRYSFDDLYYVADFDEEMQATVEELLGEVDGIIENSFDADALPDLDPAVDEFKTMLDYIKYVIKYCVLSYIVNYTAVVERILELNPDAQIIQIALMNAYANADDGSSEGTSMGDLIDMLYTPLNAFVAAVPTYLQKDGAYPKATFYYADCGTVETMTDVFGDDFYKDAEGNYIAYSDLDHIDVAEVNEKSIVRQRFVHWISGYASCGYLGVGACYCRHDGYKNNINSKIDFGEMWKHVLIDVTDPNAHTDATDYNKAGQGFFGEYDLMFLLNGGKTDYTSLVDYINLSDEDRFKAWNDDTSVKYVKEEYTETKSTPLTESTKYNFTYTTKDWAFSCEMYLAWEDAVIRAGKSSVAVANLGLYGSFDLSACEDAFANFYEKNNITSMTDEVTFNSYADVKALFQSLSDELVADPTSNIMLAMANRMEIGTGIGGHTSAGGHTDMFKTIKNVYESGYTSNEETMKNLDSFIKTNYPSLYDALFGNQNTSLRDDLAIIFTMLKMSNNEALEGVDLDALEAEIRATLRNYEANHSLEDQAAAQAATYDLMCKLQALAIKSTGSKYEADEDSFYVSLGDSNVNGYGLEGYIENMQNGLRQVVAGSAPVLLAEKLYGKDNVQSRFGQYAQGALRSEDMLSILTGKIVNPDAYWYAEIDGNLLVEGDIEATRDAYVEAIKNADLISIAVGGGNVTTFVGYQVDQVVAGKDPAEMDWAKIGYTDAVITELNEMLDMMVPLVDAMGMMNAYLPEGMEDIENPAAFARVLLESILYGYASYNYYYPQVLDTLRAINPDAQLLILGMFNPVDDWSTEIGGKKLAIGGIVNNMMEMANIQNLVFALETPNTTYVDISDNITFMDEEYADKPEELTFEVYYESVLEGNGKEVHASAAGHEYMYGQMYTALNYDGYEVELHDLAEAFYEALDSTYLTTDEKLDLLDGIYSVVKENGAMDNYPEIDVVLDVHAALNEDGYIDDEQTLSIILCVYRAVLDDKVDASVTDYIYEVLLFNDELDDTDRIEIIGCIYSILNDHYEWSTKINAVKALEGITEFLYDNEYINDEQAFAIVNFVYWSVNDGVVTNAEIREIAIFVYYTLFEYGAAMPLSLDDELELDPSLTAAEKLDIIIGIYNELKQNDVISVEEYPQLETVEELYNELTEGEDPLLTAEQTFAIIDKTFTTIVVEEEKTVDEAVTVITDSVYNEVLADESIPVEKKLEIIDKVSTAVGKLDNGEGGIDGVGGTTGSLAAMAEHMAVVKAIVASLKAEGLMTDKQATDLIGVIYNTVLSDKKVDYATVIDEVYGIVFNRDDLTMDQKVRIVVIVCEKLDEYGYTDKAFNYVDALYQEKYNELRANGTLEAISAKISDAQAAIDAANAALAGFKVSAELANLKALLGEELIATKATLEEIKYIINTVDELDEESLAAIMALEDDLAEHVANITAIAKEIGFVAAPYVEIVAELADYYAAVVSDMINDAYESLVNDVVAFNAAYVAFAESAIAEAEKISPELGAAVRNFLMDTPAEAVAIIYAYGEEAVLKLVVDAAAAAGEIYDIAAALVALIGEHGEAIYDAVVGSDEYAVVVDDIADLVAQIKALYEEAKNAPVSTALVYEQKIAELKAELEELYENLYDLALAAVEAADPEVAVMLEETLNALVEAVCVLADAGDAYVEWLDGHTKAMLGELAAIVVASIDELVDAAADAAGEAFVALVAAIKAEIKNSFDNLVTVIGPMIDEALKNEALYFDYTLSEDSYYVAIGSLAEIDGTYADILADKLAGVDGFTFDNAGLRVSDLLAILDETYVNDAYGKSISAEDRAALIAELEKADLITVDFGVADFTTFAFDQIVGKLAPQLAELEGVAELEAILGEGFLDKYTTYEMDWSRFGKLADYVDVDAILAEVRAELVANGVPEILKIEGTDVEIALADVAVFAAETYLYAFTNYVYNYEAALEAIHAINPEAEVVILGAYNVFNGLVIEIEGTVIDMTKAGEAIVDAMNLNSFMSAVTIDNTTYVGIEDAYNNVLTVDQFLSVENGKIIFNDYVFNADEAGNAYIAEQILAAMNITCEHFWDGCDDTACNFCGETREAGSHTYDADCTDADCNVCGATREAKQHVYDEDCTDTTCNNEGCSVTREAKTHVYDDNCEDTTCNNEGCKATRAAAEHVYDDCVDTTCANCAVTREAPGHTFGEWKVTKAATLDEAGEKQRTCSVCGAVETEAIAKLVAEDTDDDDDKDEETTAPVKDAETDADDTDDDDEKKGLSGGAIAGISIAAVVVLGAGGFSIYWFGIKKSTWAALKAVFKKKA